MKGKWAKGIAPRFFSWIIKDSLAVSERPGGYARNHRRVRRQEEILWLRGEGFTRVVSLLTSPHNLHAYDELDMAWAHIPFGPHDDPHQVLPDLYAQLREWMASGERLLVHHEELSDRLMGVVSGYLRWSGLVPEGPQAISVVERIMHRQMGPDGRELVAMAPQLAGAGGCAGPITNRGRTSEQMLARARESAATAAAALQAAVAEAELAGGGAEVVFETAGMADDVAAGADAGAGSDVIVFGFAAGAGDDVAVADDPVPAVADADAASGEVTVFGFVAVVGDEVVVGDDVGPAVADADAVVDEVTVVDDLAVVGDVAPAFDGARTASDEVTGAGNDVADADDAVPAQVSVNDAPVDNAPVDDVPVDDVRPAGVEVDETPIDDGEGVFLRTEEAGRSVVSVPDVSDVSDVPDVLDIAGIADMAGLPEVEAFELQAVPDVAPEAIAGGATNGAGEREPN